MNDAQVDELLEELRQTRTSFDSAVKSIKWNKINTLIQYLLIVAVFFLGGFGWVNYRSDQQANCEYRNTILVYVSEGRTQNAYAIGSALAVVFNAPPERLQQFLDAYTELRDSEPFRLEEC